MPLFWLSLSFLCGIAAAAWLTIPARVWLVLSLASFAMLLLRRRYPRFSQHNLPPFLSRTSRLIQKSPLPLTALSLAFCLGGWRYAQSLALPSNPPEISTIAPYNPVTIAGIVVDYPDQRDTYTALTLKVQRLWLAGELESRPVSGWVLVRLPPHGDWRYGDEVLVQGDLQTPPEFEGFSYRQTLARRHIYTYLPRAQGTLLQRSRGNPLLTVIYTLRQHSLETLSRIFPEPQASLLAGILLGIESGIPQWLDDAFTKSGTAHIIAISGFNITLLSGLFMSLWGRLIGRWRGALAAGLCIGLYTILVGANASVVRAALMGGLALLASQLGRRQQGINSLTFIAALMAGFQPSVLWDVSFQLSFTATLGLVLYAAPLSNRLSSWLERFVSAETAQRLGGLSSEWLLFSLAAQLTTLPVILFHFQRLSLITLVANPLVHPVQPAVMILGGMALIAGLISLPVGKILAALATPFLTYTIRIVDIMGNFPLSSRRIQPVSWLWVVGFYVILLGITLGWRYIRQRLTAVRPAFALGTLFILTSLVWQAVARAPDGRLHLILLDVSTASRSGEAVLIITPAGRSVLINGGLSYANLASSVDAWLSPTQRQLDWLIIGGGRENQISALPAFIERGGVKAVWWAIPCGKSSAAVALQETIKQQKIPLTYAESNQTLDIGEGIRLQTLAIGEHGATFLLEWNRFRAFLPVGLDTSMRDELLQSSALAPVSVWLLADRGTSWLNPTSFLQRLQPQVILLSVAPADWSGLPYPETLRRLNGQNLFRTDMNGWVHIQTDGIQMWVEAEKVP